jgi:hypothetical protein
MVNNEKGVIDMVNLAEAGAVCECGSERIAPNVVRLGSLVICATCARPARAELRLVAVPWAEVERALADNPHELYRMRWHRQGVLPENRRSLAELRRTGGRFKASDRAGVVLGLCFVLVALLLVLKAVHS